MENPYYMRQKIGSNGEELCLFDDKKNKTLKATYFNGTNMEQIVINREGKILDNLIGKLLEDGVELNHVEGSLENLKNYENELKHLRTIQKHLINVYEKEYETFLENQKKQQKYRNYNLNSKINHRDSLEQRKRSSELMKKYEHMKAENQFKEKNLNPYTI